MMPLDDFEARYQRLRADIAAVRNQVGDCPMPMAGHTAVTLLQKVLDRHPPNHHIDRNGAQPVEEGS